MAWGPYRKTIPETRAEALSMSGSICDHFTSSAADKNHAGSGSPSLGSFTTPRLISGSVLLSINLDELRGGCASAASPIFVKFFWDKWAIPPGLDEREGLRR